MSDTTNATRTATLRTLRLVAEAVEEAAVRLQFRLDSGEIREIPCVDPALLISALMVMAREIEDN